MKRLGILIVLVTLASSSMSTSNFVYICNGRGSQKYHFSQNCRGLNNCSTKLEKLPISEARSRGRTLCGWEK